MATDLWLGAATTLIGAVLGGSISFAVSRQQISSERIQREADAAREQDRRSEDRRFAAYTDFITRARSYRNAVAAYYEYPDHRPSAGELNALAQAASDSSALVFMVAESKEVGDACVDVVRALSTARTTLLDRGSAGDDDPWDRLDRLLGKTTRAFQTSARTELGVKGPLRPWQDARGGSTGASGTAPAGSA